MRRVSIALGGIAQQALPSLYKVHRQKYVEGVKSVDCFGYSHHRCGYTKNPIVGRGEDGANQFVSGRACVDKPRKFG